MGQDKIITLVNGQDESVEVELLCAFEMNDTNEEYIIYTKNELDDDKHAIIYAGKIKKDNGREYLVNIDDDKEWQKVKEVLKEMARFSEER